MSKVSVIIPVHNAGEYLAPCLDSVVAQTLEDIEIVCVDDGSSDDSGVILERYAARDERIKLVRQVHRGVSSARNRGFVESDGEYVLFLDATGHCETGLIETLYRQCAAGDADIGVCAVRQACHDGDAASEATVSLRTDMLPATVPFSVRDMGGRIFRFVTPWVSNKLIRRALIVDHDILFPEELESETDLPVTFFALAVANRITVVNEYLVTRWAHSDSSRQGAVRETPADVCRSLALLRSRLDEAGVYDSLEREYVNAALSHCLHRLRVITTSSAYCEFFEALKTRCFRELGVLERSAEYFYEQSDLEALDRILRESCAEYLFHESVVAERSLEGLKEQKRVMTARLAKSKRQLQAIRGSVPYRLGRRLAGVSRLFRPSPSKKGR